MLISSLLSYVRDFGNHKSLRAQVASMQVAISVFSYCQSASHIEGQIEGLIKGLICKGALNSIYIKDKWF